MVRVKGFARVYGGERGLRSSNGPGAGASNNRLTPADTPAMSIQSSGETLDMKVVKGAQLGHYEIVAALGKGGMGEVYLARDTRLDRRVALKILPAEFAVDSDRLHRFI